MIQLLRRLTVPASRMKSCSPLKKQRNFSVERELLSQSADARRRPKIPETFEPCALGALIAAAYQITNDLSRAHDLAISAVRPLYGSATLVNVNDVRGHAAVLALLDEVLAAM
jgi:hypothetical protein